MKDKSIRILNVEDEEVDHAAIVRMVKAMGLPYDLERAASCRQAGEMLEKNRYDIVLIDYIMPDGTGMDILKKLKAAPSIFITGRGDEEVAVSAMKAGTSDYLVKDPDGDYLELLPSIIEKALNNFRSGEERARAEKALKESEERYRAIVDTAIDAITCINEKGEIYIWNSKAENMFGYKAEEAMGRSIYDLIIPEEKRETVRKSIEDFLKTGTGKCIGNTIEAGAMNSDGIEFPVEVSISAMNISGKTHTTGIIRDISARKMLEKSLRRNLDEVERINKLMVGREIRMGELREENEKLKGKIEEMEKNIRN